MIEAIQHKLKPTRDQVRKVIKWLTPAATDPTRAHVDCSLSCVLVHEGKRCLFCGKVKEKFSYVEMRCASKCGSKTVSNVNAICGCSSPLNADATIVGCASCARKTWLSLSVRFGARAMCDTM